MRNLAAHEIGQLAHWLGVAQAHVQMLRDHAKGMSIKDAHVLREEIQRTEALIRDWTAILAEQLEGTHREPAKEAAVQYSG